MTAGETVLVTGGAGFIGHHVVRHLMAKGYRVAVVDDLSTGRAERLPAGAVFYRLNVASGPGLRRVFLSVHPAYVVHLAARVNPQRSFQSPLSDARANLLGTLRLLECCRLVAAAGQPVRNLVFTSSAAVYGNPSYLPVDEAHPRAPLSLYGLHKHTAEAYLALYKVRWELECCTLVLGNVYGPGQCPGAGSEGGVVAAFLDRAARGRPAMIYGGGEQTRDFVYVDDVAKACLLALERGRGGAPRLNLGTGRETSINGLRALLSRVTGVSLPPLWRPARPGEIGRSCLSGAAAWRELAWKPEVDLEQGLALTWQWWRAKGRTGPQDGVGPGA